MMMSLSNEMLGLENILESDSANSRLYLMLEGFKLRRLRELSTFASGSCIKSGLEEPSSSNYLIELSVPMYVPE